MFKLKRCKVFGIKVVTLFVALVSFGLLGSVARAELPTVRIGTAELVDPVNAATVLGSGTTHTISTTAGGNAEIVALARALRNDPSLIYEYVRNRIEIEPTFGLTKGALGAHLDEYGTAFDQAHLMVELLRESGFTATYQYGVISLTGVQFNDWFGIDDAKAACFMLARGGFPATVNGSSGVSTDCSTIASGSITTITMSHVWVKVTVGGTVHEVDPSFKDHTFYTGIDLGTAMVYSTTGISTAAGMGSGTDSGVSYVNNINSGSVKSTLGTYATNLLNHIRNNEAVDVTVEDVIGGQDINQEVLANGIADASLAYTTSSVTPWSGNIPNQYRTSLMVEFYDLASDPNHGNKLLYVDDYYGRTLILEPTMNEVAWQTGSNSFNARLKVDGTQVAIFNKSQPVVGQQGYFVELTVGHPYAADSGAYMDEFIKKRGDLVTHIIIVNGFGHVSQNIMSRWSEELPKDTDLPEASNSPPPPAEGPESTIEGTALDSTNLKMGANWLAQMSRMAQLQAEIGGATFQHHHSVGLIFNETYVNATDIDGEIYIGDQITRMDVNSSFSVTDDAADQTNEAAIAHAFTAAASALEGSIVEQMMDAVDTASTAERFQWGSDTGNISSNFKFYLFQPADVTAVAGLIDVDIGDDCAGFCPKEFGDPNYIAGLYEKSVFSDPVEDAITEYLNDGYSVLAPNDAFLGPGYHMGGTQNSFGPAGGATDRLPSLQRGGAFIAFREDVNGNMTEIIHVISGSQGGGRTFKGGGASLDPNHEDVFNPAEAADILSDRFENRSSALGVDLASGQPGYSSGSLISIGSGGFPYKLSAEITYKKGDRLSEGHDPHMGGMVHNWDIEASISGSGMEAMGASDVRNAVASIVAIYAAQDVASQGTTTLNKVVLVPFIQHWWAGHMSYNTVSIDAGGSGGQQFFRLVDGTYNGPAGSPVTLEKLTTNERAAVRKNEGNGSFSDDASLTRNWDYSNIKDINGDAFKLTFGDGSFQIFSNFTETGGQKFMDKTWFMMTRWEMPSGFGVSVTHQNPSGFGNAGQGPSRDVPLEVTNDLGRKLTFTYDNGSSQMHLLIEDLANGRTVDLTRLSGSTGFEITHVDGTMTLIDKALTPPAGARPIFGSLPIEAVYSPNDLVTPSLKYQYDALYRVVEAKDAQALADLTAGDPNPRPGYQFYVVPGHRGERVDPLGGEFTVYYDEDGNAVEFIDELGRTVTATYDGIGRVTRRVFPEGDESLFTYDDHSNVLSFTHVPKPASGLSNLVASATWDMTWNKPTSVTDFKGNVTSFTIGTTGSNKGQVTQATLPTVPGPTGANITPVWGFAYNADGQVTTVTDPLGNANLNVYELTSGDQRGNLKSITIDDGAGGLNLITNFEYDAIGNRIAMIDARGTAGGSTFKTTAVYDQMRRVIQTVAPEGELTLLFYDKAGQQVAVEQSNNGSWVRTETQYTVTGQEFLITSPDLAHSITVYDDRDRVLEAHDPEGRITRFTYDAAGQLLTEIRAYGTTLQQDYSTFTYSDNGQQTSIADAKGNKTEYFYDGFDRLIETRFPSKTTAGLSDPADNELFSYDANGNVLTRTTRADDVITNTYDAFNRILTKTPGLDPVVNYFYDARRRQTQVKFADNSQSIVHTYDNAGRILNTATDLGPFTKTLTYTYDNVGNRTRITHPDTKHFDYVYDESSRMTSVKQQYQNDFLARYTYDSLGRRTQMVLSQWRPADNTINYTYEPDSALDSLDHQLRTNANDVSWYFDYNNANQVTGRTITNAVYSYSPAAKNETYTSNGLNQYETVGAAALSYDPNGNLLGDGTWTYTYDVENRLMSADDSATHVDYVYDPLGRRVAKTVNGVSTYYLSDGTEEVMEYNASGTRLRRYVFGPGIDEPVVMYQGANVGWQYWYLYRADAQGTIIATTGWDGAVKDIGPYSYSSYGEPHNAGGQPIRYTGRRWDAETGLYYYRARYYNPALGRFLQTDPVGYGDNTNMYMFVANDPMNNFDPTGTVCITLVNDSSAFCRRSKLYKRINENPKIKATTNFFGAASVITEALASKDLAFGNKVPERLGGLSGETNIFLNALSASLEIFNVNEATKILTGTFEGGTIAENDRNFVRREQEMVQGTLNSLQQSDAGAFDRIVGEINSFLNGDSISITDGTFANSLRKVKIKLGRDIDFANEADRVLIGDTLVAEEKTSCLRGSIDKKSC